MARLSVIRRGNLVSRLAASLESHAERIGTAFRQLTEDFLEPGESHPDVVLVIRLLGRLIVSRFGTTLRKDRIDFDERANDRAPRSERDDSAGVLHSKLVDTRRLAEVLYGPEFSLTLVPILGTTATVPVQVLRQGEHTLERLGEAPPEPRVPGVSADLSQWADDLEPYVEKLRSSLGVLESEKTKASVTVEEKKQSMTEFDFLYSHAVEVVRGFLFLAGLEKAAQELPALSRFRRSRRGPSLEEPLPPGVDPSTPATATSVRSVRRQRAAGSRFRFVPGCFGLFRGNGGGLPSAPPGVRGLTPGFGRWDPKDAALALQAGSANSHHPASRASPLSRSGCPFP